MGFSLLIFAFIIFIIADIIIRYALKSINEKMATYRMMARKNWSRPASRRILPSG